MGKTKTPADHVTKVKKPATASQKAKTEANIKKAQDRFAQLQATQRLVAQKRKEGYFGTETSILREVNKEERDNESKKAQEFVNNALNGTHGEKIKRFLGSKFSGDPCKIAQIIKNYISTQGWKEAV